MNGNPESEPTGGHEGESNGNSFMNPSENNNEDDRMEIDEPVPMKDSSSSRQLTESSHKFMGYRENNDKIASGTDSSSDASVDSEDEVEKKIRHIRTVKGNEIYGKQSNQTDIRDAEVSDVNPIASNGTMSNAYDANEHLGKEFSQTNGKSNANIQENISVNGEFEDMADRRRRQNAKVYVDDGLGKSNSVNKHNETLNEITTGADNLLIDSKKTKQLSSTVQLSSNNSEHKSNKGFVSGTESSVETFDQTEKEDSDHETNINFVDGNVGLGEKFTHLNIEDSKSSHGAYHPSSSSEEEAGGNGNANDAKDKNGLREFPENGNVDNQDNEDHQPKSYSNAKLEDFEYPDNETNLTSIESIVLKDTLPAEIKESILNKEYESKITEKIYQRDKVDNNLNYLSKRNTTKNEGTCDKQLPEGHTTSQSNIELSKKGQVTDSGSYSFSIDDKNELDSSAEVKREHANDESSDEDAHVAISRNDNQRSSSKINSKREGPIMKIREEEKTVKIHVHETQKANPGEYNVDKSQTSSSAKLVELTYTKLHWRSYLKHHKGLPDWEEDVQDHLERKWTKSKFGGKKKLYRDLIPFEHIENYNGVIRGWDSGECVYTSTVLTDDENQLDKSRVKDHSGDTHIKNPQKCSNDLSRGGAKPKIYKKNGIDEKANERESSDKERSKIKEKLSYGWNADISGVISSDNDDYQTSSPSGTNDKSKHNKGRYSERVGSNSDSDTNVYENEGYGEPEDDSHYLISEDEEKIHNHQHPSGLENQYLSEDDFSEDGEYERMGNLKGSDNEDFKDDHPTNNVQRNYRASTIDYLHPQHDEKLHHDAYLITEFLAEQTSFNTKLETFLKVFGSQETVKEIIRSSPHIFRLSGNLVELKPQIKVCRHYLSPNGCDHKSVCCEMHICDGFLLNACMDDSCSMGHALHTGHNKKVLKQFCLENLDSHILIKIIKSTLMGAQTQKHKQEIKVCVNYNHGQCKDKNCSALHICIDYVVGLSTCYRPSCTLSHKIQESSSKLLTFYGIDVNYQDEHDIICAIVKSSPELTQMAKDYDQDIPQNHAEFEDLEIAQNNQNRATAPVIYSQKQPWKQENDFADVTDSEKQENNSGMFTNFMNYVGGILTPSEDENSYRKRNISNQGATATFASVWTHYTGGDTEIPEICFKSLTNVCKYENTGCKRLHSKLPFHWQIKTSRDNGWTNLQKHQVIHLENCYSDPSQDGTILPQADRVEQTNILFTILGQEKRYANFIFMTLIDVNETENFELRRLDLQGENDSQRNNYIWYFQDETHRWIPYGNIEVKEKSNGKKYKKVKAEEIENRFKNKGKQQLLHFKLPGNLYNIYEINFNSMRQTNVKTGVVKEIRRRPKSQSTGVRRIPAQYPLL